jgi:hypothetical protein
MAFQILSGKGEKLGQLQQLLFTGAKKNPKLAICFCKNR